MCTSPERFALGSLGVEWSDASRQCFGPDLVKSQVGLSTEIKGGIPIPQWHLCAPCWAISLPCLCGITGEACLKVTTTPYLVSLVVRTRRSLEQRHWWAGLLNAVTRAPATCFFQVTRPVLDHEDPPEGCFDGCCHCLMCDVASWASPHNLRKSTVCRRIVGVEKSNSLQTLWGREDGGTPHPV